MIQWFSGKKNYKKIYLLLVTLGLSFFCSLSVAVFHFSLSSRNELFKEANSHFQKSREKKEIDSLLRSMVVSGVNNFPHTKDLFFSQGIQNSRFSIVNSLEEFINLFGYKHVIETNLNLDTYLKFSSRSIFWNKLDLFNSLPRNLDGLELLLKVLFGLRNDILRESLQHKDGHSIKAFLENVSARLLSSNILLPIPFEEFLLYKVSEENMNKRFFDMNTNELIEWIFSMNCKGKNRRYCFVKSINMPPFKRASKEFEYSHLTKYSQLFTTNPELTKDKLRFILNLFPNITSGPMHGDFFKAGIFFNHMFTQVSNGYFGDLLGQFVKFDINDIMKPPWVDFPGLYLVLKRLLVSIINDVNLRNTLLVNVWYLASRFLGQKDFAYLDFSSLISKVVRCWNVIADEKKLIDFLQEASVVISKGENTTINRLIKFSLFLLSDVVVTHQFNPETGKEDGNLLLADLLMLVVGFGKLPGLITSKLIPFVKENYHVFKNSSLFFLLHSLFSSIPNGLDFPRINLGGLAKKILAVSISEVKWEQNSDYFFYVFLEQLKESNSFDLFKKKMIALGLDMSENSSNFFPGSSLDSIEDLGRSFSHQLENCIFEFQKLISIIKEKSSSRTKEILRKRASLAKIKESGLYFSNSSFPFSKNEFIYHPQVRIKNDQKEELGFEFEVIVSVDKFGVPISWSLKQFLSI